LIKLDELYFVFGVDKFLEPSMLPKLNMEIPEHLETVDMAISAFNGALSEYSKKKYKYDLLIDTSILSPDSAADIIIKNLKAGQALNKYSHL